MTRSTVTALSALAILAACAPALAGAAMMPKSPAQRAGLTESRYIDRTSLSERPGELIAPVAAVYPSGKPLPDSAHVVAALRARDGRTVTFRTPTIVDFGHYIAGFYYRPGATADPVSAFANFFRTKNPGNGGQLTLKNGDWYVARYVKLPAGVPIDVVGFRFNSNPAHPPATLAIPDGRMPGAFMASNPLLTRIWYSAASTMQLSIMTTSNSPYELYDGPERDRTLWLWYDASANPTAYYAFGRLAEGPSEYSYQQVSCTSGVFYVSFGCGGLPDDLGWTERDLWSLYDYYRDPSLPGRYVPDEAAHEQSVVQPHLDPRGLYRTTYLPVPPNPANPTKPGDHSMSDEMWVYAGLLGARDLATADGNSAAAAVFSERAKLLERAVEKYLWDRAKGAFVYYVGSQHVDEAGNAMAIMYGLATPAQARQILAYLHSHNDRLYDWTHTRTWDRANPAGSTDFDRPFLTGDRDYHVADWGPPWSPIWDAPWGMGTDPNDFSRQYNYNYSLVPWAEAFEVQADFTAGEDRGALSLIRRAWGTMLRRGPSTFYEGSRYDGVPAYELGLQHGSVDHRWASGVGALLQQYVLGVTPTRPGFATWQVAPHGGDLRWAQGRVPTPQGPLTTWWARLGRPGSPSAYTMVVSAPSRTRGELELPVPDRGQLTFDGHEIWPRHETHAKVSARWGRRSARLLLLGVPPGGHVLRWHS
jgi:hypothetical protein